MSYTPGPWEVCIERWPDGSLNGTPSVYAPSAGVHPAVLSAVPEIDANARLIAAAPDLLDACEQFSDWAVQLALTSLSPDDRDSFCEILRTIDDAIAKATGV